MPSLPTRIELLPEHLIDQIKAGEVIERPGSLIKEILENSIDAGSKRVELTLKNNGLDLINLKDDGHGILSADLPLAFSRHATSKISRFEDLYQLHSFGFRGEALASISAISKLQCITFNAEEGEGAEIRIEGGQTVYQGSRQKNPGQHGTEINVQDLFYNTPVRLKFIQSYQSEKNFTKKVIFSFILAHPEIEFVIKIDEEEREIYPARESMVERIQDLAPKHKEQIISGKKSYEENELEIYLIPDNLKTRVKFQYVYINNRYVLDKQLLRVISNALISVLGHDHFNFVALIKLPTDHIDVNVHPNKTIIKLFESSKVISLLTATIKELVENKKEVRLSEPSIGTTPNENKFSFESYHDSGLTLTQERQNYNMEGMFSPHQKTFETNQNHLWVGQNLLYNIEGNWEALNAKKLVSNYVLEKLKTTPSNVIPLLVSEPFKAFKIERAMELNQSGLELEKLSSDTIVLRSIPDWMNGLPLKDIVGILLTDESLEKIYIQPKEWSLSTWEIMIRHFGISELRKRKISHDLKTLLEEKFK